MNSSVSQTDEWNREMEKSREERTKSPRRVVEQIAVVRRVYSQSVKQVRSSNSCIMVRYYVTVIVMIAVCLSAVAGAECPSSRGVLNCTPKCKSDSDCSAIGGKCCLNICNERSCVQHSVLSKFDYDKNYLKDKAFANSAGSAVYCGSLKCGPFEKCVTDRYTKRPTCVRS